MKIYLERRILIRKGSKSLYDYCQENPDKLYLLEEWNYEKNKELGLTPENVSYGSNKKVWWNLPYDDSNTGKHFDFEWEASISNRVNNQGCPYLSGKAVWQEYNDLASQNPELAAQWHPTKNGNLTPDKVSIGSGKRIWWLLPYDDPKTGNHYDFEWQATISHRANDNNCPYLSGQAVWQGFNDLASQNSELAAEWHPTYNNNLKPTDVTVGSGKKVWWLCPICGYEWQARIYSRTKTINGSGCPSCNSKGTSYPDFALYYYISKIYSDTIYRYKKNKIELDVFIPSLNLGIEYDGYYWHKDKLDKDNQKDQFCKDNNIRLIRLRSNKLAQTESAETIWVNENSYNKISEGIKELLKVLNLLNNLKIDLDNDFNKIINVKTLKEKENSLIIQKPEIASEWHPALNGDLKPENFDHYSNKRVWWQCSKNPKHIWQSKINNRTCLNRGCPVCAGQKVLAGDNDLATTHENLSKEWIYEKNYPLTPQEVTAGSGRLVWWKCPICGHEWQAVINNRVKNHGCPACAGNTPWSEEEIQIMINYYESEGPTKLLKRIPNRKKNAIYNKASKLGLKYKKGADRNEDNL